MAKVSDKAVDRSKGGNLLPSGQNTISGNLYDIVNTINESMKNVEAGVDLIFNGNVDSQKSFLSSSIHLIKLKVKLLKSSCP